MSFELRLRHFPMGVRFRRNTPATARIFSDFELERCAGGNEVVCVHCRRSGRTRGHVDALDHLEHPRDRDRFAGGRGQGGRT